MVSQLQSCRKPSPAPRPTPWWRGEMASQHQPVLGPLLHHLAAGGLDLGPLEACLLAVHQLLQVAPHLHLLHVGTMALPHRLLLLTQLLRDREKEGVGDR